MFVRHALKHKSKKGYPVTDSKLQTPPNVWVPKIKVSIQLAVTTWVKI